MKNKTEIMKSVNGVASKTVMKLKKHSPEILVMAGIAGTVVSAVLACKATTKVAEILDETKVWKPVQSTVRSIRLRTARRTRLLSMPRPE